MFWPAATIADEIYLNALDWYADNGIDLRAGVRVVRIDRFAQLVQADDGTVTRYDNLILATGSRSFFPPMAGLWADNKTLDRRRLRIPQPRRLHRHDHPGRAPHEGGRHRRRAARPGGRPRACRTEACTSTSCTPGTTLMNAQLDDMGGAILRRSVEALGIGVHTRKRTTEVRTDENGRLAGIVFSDGSSIDCDMLVIAAGIRPNVGLAQRSGLTVERAIVVDDHMRSVDDDDIYVVGECAQHRGQVYGLVAPLWEQAGVLADHLTGADRTAAYHGSRTATKLKVAGVDVASMGLKAPELPDDEFVQYSEPRTACTRPIVIRDGKLVGATLLGDVSKVSFLTQAFDSGLPLPDERVSLMFDIGTPDVEVGVAELADDAQVCNCNGVNKGDAGALRAGRRDVGDRGDGEEPRRARAAGRARNWSARSSSGRPAARSPTTRRRRGTCPASPMTSRR